MQTRSPASDVCEGANTWRSRNSRDFLRRVIRQPRRIRLRVASSQDEIISAEVKSGTQRKYRRVKFANKSRNENAKSLVTEQSHRDVRVKNSAVNSGNVEIDTQRISLNNYACIFEIHI